MAKIEIQDLKSLREALCVAQSAIAEAYPESLSDYKTRYIDQLQKTLDQIDILRPIGPDGNHGDLHTDHCGCDHDKP